MKNPAKIMPIIHWILSIILGTTLINSTLSPFLIFLSSITFTLGWCFAVGINDYYDIEIDRVINPTRPLITEQLSLRDVKIFFIISGTTALIFSILTDILNLKFGITLLTGIYLLLGIFYSMPPIRIKQRTFLSSAVIGLVTAECILVGGFLTMITFQGILYATLLGFMVTFVSAAKDLKDIEGDRAAGIPTIPTKYPEKAALIFQIINVCSYSSLFILYLFQPLPWYFGLILLSIIFLNIPLYQRFKKKPNKANAELIYKVGFSLYLLLSILLIILNL
ncbi:MAG: UbiA family prenyltransferase [Candidatus Helarchaeota archaeon]